MKFVITINYRQGNEEYSKECEGFIYTWNKMRFFFNNSYNFFNANVNFQVYLFKNVLNVHDVIYEKENKKWKSA